MPTTHLLYLHGFRSSPRSVKAQKVATRLAQRHPGVTAWFPQLPPSPGDAVKQVMQGIAGWPRHSMAVMGSSLGGFYATWVAQQTGCRAVLLNPAVNPARDLASYIGAQTDWHKPEERFFFKPEFVDELRELESGHLHNPERLFALIAKGDEVLDWREMVSRYPGATIQLLDGGDHALSDFATHMDAVFDFLGLADHTPMPTNPQREKA